MKRLSSEITARSGIPPISNPQVNFLFYYGNGEVEDSIYQENDPTVAPAIKLEVFNDSEQEVIFAPSSAEVSNTYYHFGVKFPQGLLVDLAQSSLEETGDWEVGYDPDTDDHYEVIYFLKKTQQTLAPNGEETLLLTLLQFCAQDSYQSPTANIYLTYGPLMQDSDGGSLESNDPELKAIDIIDRTSKSNIPLHVGFVGSNTILNDGDTENSLTLQITNTNSPNSVKPNLSFNSESKLIVSFDTGEASNKAWALAEAEKVKNIAIVVTDTGTWQVQHEPNSTEWTVSLQGDSLELEAGDFIQLNLSNIVTEHPTGNTNLYLRYEAIPDYRDGRFEAIVEKTPLLFRGGNVGISAKHPKGLKFFSPHSDAYIDFVLTSETNNNQAVLALNGNTGTTHGRSAYIASRGNSANDYATDLGFKVRSDGDWEYGEIEDALTIKHNGNVGIGTTAPQGKLHLCHQSGNSGNTDLVIERQDHNSFLKLKAQDNQARITFNKKLLKFDSDDVGSTQVQISGDDGDDWRLHVNGRIKDKTGYVMPVGTIVAYAGSSAPTGWLLCDGRTISRSQYQELYDVIGTHYGGSGKLPNLKGKVPVGLNSGDNDFKPLGKSDGEKTHKLTVNEMPSHKHGIRDEGHRHGIEISSDNSEEGHIKRGGYNSSYGSKDSYIGHADITMDNNGGSGYHNNLQPYLTINYIIKA